MGIFRVLLLAVLLFSFVGCSQKHESKLIGTWQHVQLQERVEFNKDMTGSFEVMGKPPVHFRWIILPENEFRLDIVGMGTPHSLMGKLENGQFILEGDQMKAVYRRVDK